MPNNLPSGGKETVVSEMEKLLKVVSVEVWAKAISAFSQNRGATEEVQEVLRRKLLPLLEAGEAMRNDIFMDPDCAGEHLKWDAAKLATLKGDS